MAYKATGRPVGRPKTKDYKTISLKMPQELLDRVQTYAGQHRQTISELIRDGLEWRITEGDPRWPSMPDKRYSGNTELDELAQPIHLVDEHIPFDEDGRHAPEAPVPPVSETSHNGNTVTVPALPGQPAAAVQQTKAMGLAQSTVLAHLSQMRASGLSFQQMADQLQAEGVPTLSGKGAWNKGTVAKLLAKHQGQPGREPSQSHARASPAYHPQSPTGLGGFSRGRTHR